MFDQLISRASLEELAGAAVFERGEAYFGAGAVARLRITADKITAKVTGSETWRVDCATWVSWTLTVLVRTRSTVTSASMWWRWGWHG